MCMCVGGCLSFLPAALLLGQRLAVPSGAFPFVIPVSMSYAQASQPKNGMRRRAPLCAPGIEEVCLPWLMSLDTDPSGHTGQETSHSKPLLPLPSVHYSELNSLCTTEDGNWRSEPWRRATLGGLCFLWSTGPLDPCPECVGVEFSPSL